MHKSLLLMNRQQAGVVVVDVQERLVPAMCEKEWMVTNVVRLVKAARILGLPIFATEQYRKGLGPTVPEIAGAIPGFAPVEKYSFSACGAEGFVAGLRARGVQDVVLCGIEAHVCVSQTCLDLLAEGFRVFVAADALASRTSENCRAGIERMQGAGAAIVSTEMALFELLEKAGTAEFKEILNLVK